MSEPKNSPSDAEPIGPSQEHQPAPGASDEVPPVEPEETPPQGRSPAEGEAVEPAPGQADGDQQPPEPPASEAPPAAAGAIPERRGGCLGLLVFLAVGLFLGRTFLAADVPAERAGERAPAVAPEATVWTCSMHPQIREDGPGKCPICGMTLVPVKGDDNDDDLDPASLAMSENAMALAGVVTAAVERRPVSRQVRMVGKVAYDETLLSYITAWVPSRLDRMYVDYTGVTVRKGDHMALVYSPDLIATQQELFAGLEAERLLNTEGSGVSAVVERQAGSVQSAKDRLRLWGLDPQQIEAIVESGVVQEHVTINSPASGVVIEKKALQGDQVSVGTRIYTIADLSRLWVQLDAYESDLGWLHYGQRVQFTTEAWPGEVLEGRISFIDPVLNDRTRTIKVRLNVDNSDGRLKPDMFVHAVVEAPMTAGGQLVDAELAGKFMCPMHPEVVADGPGICNVCGMELASTEDLGFRRAEAAEVPLVIPASAPLITGTRAVVYVRVPETEKPTFVGRQIMLGPRAGDWYIVSEGSLKEGDQVVVRGNFKIDSELQIRARPSMMNPVGGGRDPGHDHGGTGSSGDDDGADHEGLDLGRVGGSLNAPAEFGHQLDVLLPPYLALHDALAIDDATAARRAGGELAEALAEVGMSGLEGPAHRLWMEIREQLLKATGVLAGEADLDAQRLAFGEASEALITVLEAFGRGSVDGSVSVFHCPIALGGGATWMAAGDEVRNPYLGQSMPGCGDRLRGLGEER